MEGFFSDLTLIANVLILYLILKYQFKGGYALRMDECRLSVVMLWNDKL